HSKIKLGRIGEIEDTMGAVAFIASSASAMIIGSSLMIDGGGQQGSIRHPRERRSRVPVIPTESGIESSVIPAHSGIHSNLCATQ
ncbi:MAG: hypothetical protein O7B81_16795, partial [Gammaproteobacteria bacterium]|nr:hypothetical protein [Gammaproteobacteria bacterium]